MKIVYIIGDDKIGRVAINMLKKEKYVLRNRTVNIPHVIKLIRNNVISISDIINMAVADLYRKKIEIRNFPAVKTNEDLFHYLNAHKPDYVICYRAGLVVNKRLLELGPHFLNIHCADLPEFPGLGSIPQALRAGVLNQNACLHKMAVQVDAGQVLYKVPYKLSNNQSYRTNEDLAYTAGRKILIGIKNGNINLEEISY